MSPLPTATSAIETMTDAIATMGAEVAGEAGVPFLAFSTAVLKVTLMMR